MTIDTTLTQFAEFVGSEVKRIEKKIPDGGGSGSQSSDSMIITGNGRPDEPETTQGKIAGGEKKGTIFISLNGDGDMTYLWQKQYNRWVVVSGDTGDRKITTGAVNIKQGYVLLRRVNNIVTCSFTGGPWGAISFYGSSNSKFTKKNHAKRMDILQNSKIPIGFRPSVSFMLPFYSDDGDNVGMVYVGGTSNHNYIELRFKDKVPTDDMDVMRMPVITWITNEPFPKTLP